MILAVQIRFAAPRDALISQFQLPEGFPISPGGLAVVHLAGSNEVMFFFRLEQAGLQLMKSPGAVGRRIKR